MLAWLPDAFKIEKEADEERTIVPPRPPERLSNPQDCGMLILSRTLCHSGVVLGVFLAVFAGRIEAAPPLLGFSAGHETVD